MTDTRQFLVEGLVCGTCLVEVLDRLHEVDGVAKVGISLNPQGASPAVVHCAPSVPNEELRRAVAEAGSFLISPGDCGPAEAWRDDQTPATALLARGGVL